MREPEPHSRAAQLPQTRSATAALALRGTVGGVLMGLANLVPGISGGTMLLAAGVYRGFIGAIAELTTLRFRPRSLVLLASIALAAATSILFFAGAVRDLVVHQRWLMYSLFIGLTLGGVPLLWRLARPATPALWLCAAASFAAMAAMALTGPGASGDDTNAFWMFMAGLAAASAMVLPGVSGGYLLLLLGQYEPILGTVDQLKRGLLGDAVLGTDPDLALVMAAMGTVIPLGLGVVAGVAGVSNALAWLLRRYEKATLGALLGLLLGAVVGLWPFQEATEPVPGEVVKGRMVSAEDLAEIDPEDWPLRRFRPTSGQAATAAGCVAVGLLATWAIGRLGRSSEDDGETTARSG